MKVGDEVYLSPKSKYANRTEANPLGIKGEITGIDGSIGVRWENGKTNGYSEEDLILASEYEKENMPEPKGHPNAGILMEIAKEAAVNTEYWKEYEVNFYDEEMTIEWIVCRNESDLFYGLQNDINIRRKPRTIRIGNYNVPEPTYCNLSNLSSAGDSVLISFDEQKHAELMLKALQELLGVKQ